MGRFEPVTRSEPAPWSAVAGMQVKVGQRQHLSVRIWKCVDPIHDLIVPKGGSTVCLRTRILSGSLSRRCCMASITRPAAPSNSES